MKNYEKWKGGWSMSLDDLKKVSEILEKKENKKQIMLYQKD